MDSSDYLEKFKEKFKKKDNYKKLQSSHMPLSGKVHYKNKSEKHSDLEILFVKSLQSYFHDNPNIIRDIVINNIEKNKAFIKTIIQDYINQKLNRVFNKLFSENFPSHQ